MAYRALEKLINLHDGYRGAFRTSRGEVLLLQDEGEAFLLARHCPHQEALLDAAPCANGVITCPRHELAFSMRDGHCVNGNCGSLRVYPIAYEGNTLGVDED